MFSKKKKSKATSLFSMFISSLIIYWIFNGVWNPTEFNPWAYWNLTEGGFWETFQKFIPFAFILPLLISQLSWLNNDRYLKLAYGLSQPSLLGAVIRGFYAGSVEEFTFRGVFIYTTMIGIALSNKFFPWLIALSLIVIATAINMRLANKALKWIVYIVSGGVFLWLTSSAGADPIYALYQEYYIPAYTWILSAVNFASVLKFFAVVWILESLVSIGGAVWIKSGKFLPMHTQIYFSLMGYNELITPLQIAKNIAVSASVYGITLWSIHLTDPTIVLEGPILLVSAITSLAVGFGRGHQYQGFSGVLSAIAFAFYMQYVTFTYGLVYAIAVHICYDVVLFVVQTAIARYKMRNMQYSGLDVLFGSLR